MVGRTQMKKIGTVLSYLFENHIILSLSKDWITICKGLPEFEVRIDDQNRLQLISKQVIGSEVKRERDTKKEDDKIG